uniref:Leptin n=1 Tax=Neogobius melanostomus TaxID=47308 RepID=A0A8C6SKA8_9GOBI
MKARQLYLYRTFHTRQLNSMKCKPWLTFGPQIPPLLTTAPPSGEQYGAASLVLIMKGYNNLILDSFNGAPEIKAEIESLYRFVDQLRKRNCADKPQPYSVSITYSALYRVREYLKNLLKNLEQLEMCT